MTAAQHPLCKRLAGYDVIAAVIDDMFTAMRADPAFARFGAGRSLDSHNHAPGSFWPTRCANSAEVRACTSDAT
jgi:hypothetical protein